MATSTEPAAPAALPRLMLVTLRDSMKPTYGDALQAALRGGARLIQLREPPGGTEVIRELAGTTADLCKAAGAGWLWNGDELSARTLGADGVHWPERKTPSVAPHTGGNFLRGASVHSIEAARRALAAGADYLVFGSVWETASHPGGAPAGLEMLRTICEVAAPVPVYAIGGVTVERVAECRAAGAYGVAVMRAVWDAPNIEVATRAFCEQQ